MAEFFVFSCRQCRSAYAAPLEATDCPEPTEGAIGLCPDCLERLIGWAPTAEEVETREDRPDSPPDA